MAESSIKKERPQFQVVATVGKQEQDPITKAVAQSNALEVEDEFMKGLSPTISDQVLIPPYDPEKLRQLVKENNSIRQCIDAMEVNVDGTGYHFAHKEEREETEEEDERIKEIEGFFNEPYPGISFTTQRRALRREQEEVGYAFLEVIRNPQDEILFSRMVPSHTVRLMKLDDPVEVEKTVMRNGKEVKTKVAVRERRFVQKVADKHVFFREFGTSRDVNKETGEWSESGARLKAHERGSELIYLLIHKDSNSPYGVPRWINQIPSVLGSRKAEEMNLNFFDNEGIPTALIFLHGELTGSGTKETIEQVLNAKQKDRLRAAVVTVSSVEGSLERGGGNAKVQVERFSSEQQNDAMFEGYDEKSEKRIRASFRLPPLFVGRTEGYNYATAYASYAVAEAQVFKPERDEFDEKITITLLKELGYTEYKMVSHPLSISDAIVQLKGVEMTKEYTSPQNQIDAVNEICNLDMQFDEEGYNEAKQKEQEDKDRKEREAAKRLAAYRNQSQNSSQEGQEGAGDGSEEGTGTSPLAGQGGGQTAVNKLDHADLFDLARDYATLIKLREGELTPELKKATKEIVGGLAGDERAFLDYILATQIYTRMDFDPEGLAKITHAACDCLED